ncbi:MAG: hypothetical protein Q9186_000259 [Xanthomendoza sp. 1 TL-2023]
MAKKSRLLSALDAHKNLDHNLERQKKLQKQAAKRKRSKEPDRFFYKGEPLMSGGLQTRPDNGDVASEQDDGSETIPAAIDTSHIDDSDTNSENSTNEPVESEEKIATNGTSLDHPAKIDEQSRSASEASDEDDQGIPLSDLSDLSETEKADIIPHQRLTINNTIALTKAYHSIALPPGPFSTHQTLTSPSPVSIPNIDDDLNRELAFHAQALSAAAEGRRLLKKEGIAFSRPNDYFAEMVKSDEQMGKVKGKMHEEAAGRKAAAEARRQRDLRKFGKQVQVAKLQERDKAKRETLEKIDILKRKRKNTDTGGPEETDQFDIALDDAGAGKSDKPPRSSRREQSGRGPSKRQKKDDKFGFGGKKRFAKSGDAVSSSDLSGFNAKRMKGRVQKKSSKGGQRLGKSRRVKR